MCNTTRLIKLSVRLRRASEQLLHVFHTLLYYNISVNNNLILDILFVSSQKQQCYILCLLLTLYQTFEFVEFVRKILLMIFTTFPTFSVII